MATEKIDLSESWQLVVAAGAVYARYKDGVPYVNGHIVVTRGV